VTESKGLRDELLRLETALATRDGSDIDGGLPALIHPEFLEFGSSGRVWDATSVRTLLNGRGGPVEIKDFGVAELADGVALATYRMVAPIPSNRSSLWVRDGDDPGAHWVMRFHQGTRTGE
jgi:ribonuclease HI